jgi:hypothetical protein
MTTQPKWKADDDKKLNLEGLMPESWFCIDCGINTAPAMLNRVEMEKAISLDAAKAKLEGREWSIPQSINHVSEVYTVRSSVWKTAGMEPMGGCLCIGCLEERIGRRLTPKDFARSRAFNSPQIPGTERLKSRMSP